MAVDSQSISLRVRPNIQRGVLTSFRQPQSSDQISHEILSLGVETSLLCFQHPSRGIVVVLEILDLHRMHLSELIALRL